MKAYLLSGMSGAGKSLALKYMEDMGMTCIDNIPQSVLGNILEAFSNSEKDIAVSVDVRSAFNFDAKTLLDTVQTATSNGYQLEMIFLDASEDVLLNRYQESRREHPLSDGRIGLRKAIAIEKEKIAPLKERAKYLIDTSKLKPRALQKKINEIVEKEQAGLMLDIMSFGYKRGIPDECDLVFDVRVLPNPFYIKELGTHTGLEECIQNFVLGNSNSQTLLIKLQDLLQFLIPCYVQEGKKRLVIGVGCTGGAHRSVAMAEELAKRMQDFSPRVNHRDLEAEQALWVQNHVL
ncbi:MAG: RNase adapter RapZ [Eubacteriales bacterium]|nr:RNase adapter RapZ [Eubacteriales bacterium]